MTLTIALIWCLLAIATAYLWHRVRRSQPRPRMTLLPRTAPPVDVTITLTQRQLANIQLAALAVSLGAEKAIGLGCDYANSAGVGRLIILICDEAVFTKAVSPALEAHLKSGSGA